MADWEEDTFYDEELEATFRADFEADFESTLCKYDIPRGTEDESVEDPQIHDENIDIESEPVEDTEMNDENSDAEQTIKPIPLAERTPSAVAAQVFAIPELLEMILLDLNLHTKGPFKTGHVANAVKLCRLESVNRAFRDTLRGSPSLKLPKQNLNLNENPGRHAAVIWLLRELGHSRSGILRDMPDVLIVKRSPGYGTAVVLKQEFEIAMVEDRSWRQLKIAKPMTIRFDDRSVTYRHVESYVGTLGELWKKSGSRL